MWNLHPDLYINCTYVKSIVRFTIKTFAVSCFFYRVCCPPSRSMLNENDKKSRQQKQNPSMNYIGTMRIQGQNFFFVSGQFHLTLFAISQVYKMDKLFQWFRLQSKIDGVFNSRKLWYVLMNIFCCSMAICTTINLTCFRT